MIQSIIQWRVDSYSFDDIRETGIVNLRSMGGLVQTVYCDSHEEFKRYLRSYGIGPLIDYCRPAYYEREGGSMCNGIGRDYF